VFSSWATSQRRSRKLTGPTTGIKLAKKAALRTGWLDYNDKSFIFLQKIQPPQPQQHSHKDSNYHRHNHINKHIKTATTTNTTSPHREFADIELLEFHPHWVAGGTGRLDFNDKSFIFTYITTTTTYATTTSTTT
jgi:hypothetical protein